MKNLNDQRISILHKVIQIWRVKQGFGYRKFLSQEYFLIFLYTNTNDMHVCTLREINSHHNCNTSTFFSGNENLAFLVLKP